MSASPDATTDLKRPLRQVFGIGPARAELLAKLGLRNVRQLLLNFPREWHDLAELKPVAQFQENEALATWGEVVEVDFRELGSGNKNVLGVLFQQQSRHFRAVWFNSAYLRDRFSLGECWLCEGKPRWKGTSWEFAHPKTQKIESPEEYNGRLQPVYGLTDGLSQAAMRQIMEKALEQYGHLLDEVFPEEFRRKHDLFEMEHALRQLHFPESQHHLEQARRRFIFQELLVLQLAMASRRQLQQQVSAVALEVTPKIDARIRRLFPFELTRSQDRTLRQLGEDLSRPHPMNRLVQGDVGSGKTVIALYAMLVAVAHGQQAALMAPTEILARQHWQTFQESLGGSRVRARLLVGSLPAVERREVLSGVQAGEIDLLIGTQALLQEQVEFANLAVVVIDEQHRFGVLQRAKLKQAGQSPHYLLMTATPIPRTLSMTAYGDLEVSSLRDLPPGRAKIHTYLAEPEQRGKWWEFFRRKLSEGRQGYVITPWVESQSADRSIEQLADELRQGELKDYRLAILHGRLSSLEQQEILEAFREQEIDVLVATSVVEVGLDVPNATLMTIENAQQFGLAALHQLRGRICRSSHPAYCCVFASAVQEQSLERLEAFVNTSNGFELAEIDFQLRGPGNLIGTRQHGLPRLHIADLGRDYKLLTELRDVADQLLRDERWHQEEFAKLRALVERKYGKVLNLSDVG